MRSAARRAPVVRAAPRPAATGRGGVGLVKTSNPSSGELQDKKLESGATVSEEMAALVRKWNEPLGESGYGSVGAVVGATYPQHLKELRGQLL